MIGRDYSRLVQSCGRQSECLNLEERTERTHYGWANVEATKKDTAKVWICVPWPVLPGHTRDFATRVVAGRAGHGHPSSSFSLAFLETEWNRMKQRCLHNFWSDERILTQLWCEVRFLKLFGRELMSTVPFPICIASKIELFQRDSWTSKPPDTTM